MSNDLLTSVLVACGALFVAIGSALVASLGVGLIVGGVLGVAWTVLFIREVEETK